MAAASQSRAGVWATQPVIGIQGDYYTNPSLVDSPNTAESHADLLLDAPTNYVGDAYKVTIMPSFRISNAQGYSYLDSNYEHVRVINEFDTERDTVAITAGLSQDSSLYHDYLLNGSTGVRRDSAAGDFNWDRRLTELTDLDMDANWTRVRYGGPVGTATLVDYEYASTDASLSWNESERCRLTGSVNLGRYNSLGGTTESTNANVQAGVIDKLSEIWTLTASAGYSRADNRDNLVVDESLGSISVLVPVSVKTSQIGSVYSVTLNRQTPLLSVSATASRQLTPTGFAFLSRQEFYQLQATYTATERWTIGGDVHRVTYYQQSTLDTSGANLNITSFDVSAARQLNEHWTVTMMATHVMERNLDTHGGVSSTGVSIQLSRQFNWKSLQ